MTDEDAVDLVARALADGDPRVGRRASRALDRRAGDDSRKWLRLYRRGERRAEQEDSGGRSPWTR